jgi:hypothetical protein
LGLDPLSPQLLNFLCEYRLGRGCAVDTVCLDLNDNTTSYLKELMGVLADDTSLVWLGNIRKDA